MLASGKRIRVEPDDAVELADKITDNKRVDKTKRILSATLRAGAEVYVHGLLSHDVDPEYMPTQYRGAGRRAPVLRPSPDHAMVISSTPLHRSFLKRAKFHALWALVYLLAALALNAHNADYHVNLWSGQQQNAHVVRKWTLSSHDEDGYQSPYYRIRVVDAQNRHSEHSIGLNHYQRLKAGVRVALLVSPRRPAAAQLGRQASLSLANLAMAAALLIALQIGYLSLREKTRPWHRRKVEHRGIGGLPGNNPIKS